MYNAVIKFPANTNQDKDNKAFNFMILETVVIDTVDTFCFNTSYTEA